MTDLGASDAEKEEAGGLWGGRFEEGMAPEMVPFNLSLGIDARLWREDVRGSVAWARAIGRAGVLSEDETETIVRGLGMVAERIEREGLADAPEEDIHSVVERDAIWDLLPRLKAVGARDILVMRIEQMVA